MKVPQRAYKRRWFWRVYGGGPLAGVRAEVRGRSCFGRCASGRALAEVKVCEHAGGFAGRGALTEVRAEVRGRRFTGGGEGV